MFTPGEIGFGRWPSAVIGIAVFVAACRAGEPVSVLSRELSAARVDASRNVWSYQILPSLSLSPTSTKTMDINDYGVVVGSSSSNAVKWVSGSIAVLPGREAVAINNAGDVVVNYGFGGSNVYLLRASGFNQNLSPAFRVAADMNETGTVVGQGSGHCAVRWSIGTGYQSLPCPSHLHPEAEALAVNANGYAVGWASMGGVTDPAYAATWNPSGSFSALGAFYAGGTIATGINAASVIVGWTCCSAGGSRAFGWWWYSGFVDLGFDCAEASDVSDKDRIVGKHKPHCAGPELPFTSRQGVWTTLPTPGGIGGRADAVNACGQVAGVLNDGRPVIWTPWSCDL